VITTQTHYDVVVVGSGLVGGSFALMLSQLLSGRSLKLLCIDARPLTPISDQTVATDFDARSTALSWGSRQIYEKFGLWSAMSSHAANIDQIHVSDRGHPGVTRLQSQEMNVEALGYVIENQYLSRAIQNALLKDSALETCAPASVTRIQHQPDGMQLDIDSQGKIQTIDCSLLVLADGGRSGLMESLGITTRKRRYEQHAIIANVAIENPHQGQAFERFTDAGPMAMLPLPDLDGPDGRPVHRAALVWTVPDEEKATTLNMDPATFLRTLQTRFGYRLGRLIQVGERSAYPLTLVEANEQIRPGLVLLGNAAHTLHPVAGQGLNLALRDSEALAAIVAEQWESTPSNKTASRPNPGSYAVLERYLERQRQDQERTVLFSDLTTRLFSNQQSALALGRNLGLISMDLLPPARHWFARQAMGLR
jgi:2-octaprenyl-6-methoxyphenol hydroxylase